MQTSYQPGWPPMGGQPQQQPRQWRTVIGTTVIVIVGWVIASTVGLLAAGLVFAVAYLLVGHRRQGTLGRALVEYTVVALAVALFMANAAVTPKVSVPAPPTSQSLEQGRQNILDGWEGIATGFTNWREGAGR